MRKFALVIVLALAGCGVEITETYTPDAADSVVAGTSSDSVEVTDVTMDVCSLTAQRQWDYGEGASATIDAAISCADGQRMARRDILGGDGEPLYTFSAPVEHVAVLAWAESDDALFAAFAEWADHDPRWTSTAALPPFDQQAEFPFYPGTADQAVYDAWRAGDYPMDCFIQGMESQMCVAMIDGEAVEMGVQSFPG
ncbi:hypothetical protein [Maricaulis sp.]|uniref:hypothetical protein n=1 Tax=Maricaulis sp. TaxID=1486257 RepID=UPI002618F195|nr:hypothetical protein [Maricaulis sp.]